MELLSELQCYYLLPCTYWPRCFSHHLIQLIISEFDASDDSGAIFCKTDEGLEHLFIQETLRYERHGSERNFGPANFIVHVTFSITIFLLLPLPELDFQITPTGTSLFSVTLTTVETALQPCPKYIRRSLYTSLSKCICKVKKTK